MLTMLGYAARRSASEYEGKIRGLAMSSTLGPPQLGHQHVVVSTAGVAGARLGALIVEELPKEWLRASWAFTPRPTSTYQRRLRPCE